MLHLRSSEWNDWQDPIIPTYFNPTERLLDRHVSEGYGEKLAIVVDDEERTYSQLLDQIRAVAQGLSELGLRREDRLLFFGTDSIEYVETWLGALRIGIVPAAVSDLNKSNLLAYFLNDTAARALFIDHEQLTKLEEIAGELPSSLRYVIVRGDPGNELLQQRLPGFEILSANDLASYSDHSCDAPMHHQNEAAYMLYSGGTTGTPKGIMHLAHDFILVPERHGSFWEYTRSDVCFATSKKYFTHGLWPGLLIPLYFGATAILSRYSLTPEVLASAITRRKPTVLVTVPTVVKQLLAWQLEGGRLDLQDIRLAVTASERLPDSLFERFHEIFGCELLDSVGSSEVTYEWIANRPSEARRNTLGKPVFGYDIAVMDENGMEIVEPDIPGEAWVKSLTSCQSYWRKLSETQYTFIGEWTRTGDVVQFDKDGFYRFAGRRDDLFKVHGLWVSPLDVEACIARHTDVADVAVVGGSDGAGFTEVVAFVVLRPEKQASPELDEALKNTVRPIGAYKVPARFVYLESLPRSSLAKLDRRALRASLLQSDEAQAPS
jgi:benzoate-CoA ligase